MVVGATLSARLAANLMQIALYQGKEYMIGLVDGKLGVSKMCKRLHCLASCAGPNAVDVTPVAADFLQLTLQGPRQGYSFQWRWNCLH